MSEISSHEPCTPPRNPSSVFFWFKNFVRLVVANSELKQPRRRRQQERHKSAYLIENNSFARFARTFFIFGHFANVLVLSMTWNDLFCSFVDDVGIWWQMLNFVLLPLKRWFQFKSRLVRIHFASSITLNNWETLGINWDDVLAVLDVVFA